MRQAITLKVALFVPPHNPATVMLSRLAEVVRERSNQRLRLQICHSEELGTTAQHYDLACSGEADIAYMIHSATPGRFPLTELAALAPVSDALTATKALQSRVPAKLAEEHAGVKLLFLTANMPMAIHSVHPLRRPDDLHGLRIGHSGRVAAATLNALGAIPVTVMPLAIREALRSGAIDATSMTYEAALVLKLADLVRCSYELNANTITFGLVMHPRSYQTLAPDLQSIIDAVLGQSAGLHLAAMLASAAQEGRQYLRDSGVTIVEPDAHDRHALDVLARDASEAFIAQLAGAHPCAPTVFAALKVT